MDNQDHRASRAAALSAARRRLARLKVAAVTGSVFAFAGLSAGMALKTTSKVVASSSVSTASTTVPVASATPTDISPTAGSSAAVAAAVPTAVPVPAAAASKKSVAPIVSAQS